ncbi:ABC transporter ATP-binding protein [Halomonas sp. 1390]|uniref:ABC transporter ATP-binding protein n=1 Tax=Halomonas sp. B23F22_3 TaxID=3459516 RepID=UPI00373F68F3
MSESMRASRPQQPRRQEAQGQDASTPEPLIRVRGLVNRFGKHVVHEDLDLDLYSGEILGVVGGSGTGKSVLLRSIVGLLRPSEGRIEVFGEDLQRLAPRERSALERRFGVLFQRGALFTSLTLEENVALPLIEHAGLARGDAEALARVKLALAGLPVEAATQYPAALSGGMIKRAALARALALDPEVLFLDEPTAGLDPIGAAAFDRLILTLRDALGLSVFLVTHDLDTLYTACDRVAVLARRQVRVADRLSVVEATDDAWIHDYFHGPRGRAARRAAHPAEDA